MEIIQNLSSIASWPSLIFMLVFIVTGSIYVKRTAKAQADEIEKKANKSAIEALQTQVNVLTDRIKYLESALREVGIHVTLDGKIEHIHKSEE